jgi:hypothetical protein
MDAGMNGAPNRWLEFAEALSPAKSAPPSDWSPCTVCKELLLVSGAAISLMNDGPPQQLCASDDVAAKLEELQFTLGEGPAPEAHASGEAVAESDVGQANQRWPAFAAPAAEAGAGAIFAFPLRVGAARIGVLSLYQGVSGPLASVQHADALLAAGVVTQTIIAVQAKAPPSVLADVLEGTGFREVQVHQASGMISVQLGVGIAEALVRLRSYAFVQERSVKEIAADVVSRRLRFDNMGPDNEGLLI